MAQVQFDVPYSEQRNRGTVAIRLILAIPHLIIIGVWSNVVQVVAVIQWFIQVFTGKRNRGLTEFTLAWLNYAARVYGYVGLLFDEYPEFVSDEGKTPVRFAMPYEEGPVNRLTVGLRIIWAIPALVIAWLLSIAIGVVTILGWFVILFTGLACVPRQGAQVRAAGVRLRLPDHRRVPEVRQRAAAWVNHGRRR